MTLVDFANVARLRKLQRLGNASLNAIVSRIDNTGAVRPSDEQWADLWPALEAANKTAQQLADQLAAAQVVIKAGRRRGGKASVTLASTMPLPEPK